MFENKDRLIVKEGDGIIFNVLWRKSLICDDVRLILGFPEVLVWCIHLVMARSVRFSDDFWESTLKEQVEPMLY